MEPAADQGRHADFRGPIECLAGNEPPGDNDLPSQFLAQVVGADGVGRPLPAMASSPATSPPTPKMPWINAAGVSTATPSPGQTSTTVPSR